MVKETRLVAEKRAVTGTSAVKRIRREGWLPAVVCNDKGQAEAIQINAHDFDKLLHRHTSENILFDIEIAGAAAKKVLLKEVQHDPVQGQPLHADFVEVSMTRKMRVAIPIVLVGEPVGVSQEGGILEHILRELDVECLPGDLVESISVDVASLQLNHTILVRDLKVDPRLTILAAGDMAVATVAIPRKEEEVVAEVTAEAAATAEPEVITAKKEEGEEGAEGETAKPEESKEKSKEKPKEKTKEKPKEKGKEK